ncbi:helix-turn-helix domain-containing protein [Nocardioides sp.]|uniref:helix-turn-helix domain-containing protein n=1 Tax=Nocardioides sp. TaxID=35761 RepID=UPI002609C04A|nr:helix-turn-helix domain-containing protein [Nocardioides sp.]
MEPSVGSDEWPVSAWERVGYAALGQRRRLGITQADLALRSGVSRAWIVAFERGHQRADPQNALRVLAALGLELVVRPVQVSARQERADQALATIFGDDD